MWISSKVILKVEAVNRIAAKKKTNSLNCRKKKYKSFRYWRLFSILGCCVVEIFVSVSGMILS